PTTVEVAPRHVVNLTAMRLVPAATASPPTGTPTPTPTPAPASRAVDPRVVPSAPQQAPSWTRPPVAAQPVPVRDDGRTVVRGARRPRPGPVPERRVAPAPPPRWRVTFDDGETFVVEGLALVGRRPEPRGGEPVHHVVPLSSTDMSLSKTHAQIGQAPDGALVVMDRGSTNGSVLLRRGVARELTAGKPATVLDGDTVRFGDREMTVSREA
ncbi:FHA domain-containing protein, partial [uncultured Nocardioides sp.]|uniref:FHA domain-containing protein n=1 Tax=uncultured Nocardioides sp. TaxID=198441 RepID=UPI0025DAEA5C